MVEQRCIVQLRIHTWILKNISRILEEASSLIMIISFEDITKEFTTMFTVQFLSSIDFTWPREITTNSSSPNYNAVISTLLELFSPPPLPTITTNNNDGYKQNITFSYLYNLIERLIGNWNWKKKNGKLISGERERGKNQKKKTMFVAGRESLSDYLTLGWFRPKHS